MLTTDMLHRRVKLLAVREQLPVWTARRALLQHITENDCLVVVGETGSGKTTQIPQLLVKAGLADEGCIACTQPRRVAAITVAGRVAQEYPCHLGQEACFYDLMFQFELTRARRTVAKGICSAGGLLCAL